MYFRKQQQAIGAMNGYIEEMMEGQKVVKVFCYEERAKHRFDQLNANLCQASTNAHTFANILMPTMNNLSYVNYAITAIFGSIMAIYGRLDLGTVAAFLQYTRSFSQPITQISQQFNALLNALAGAERIFQLMDELPEADPGRVTLNRQQTPPVWQVPQANGAVKQVPLAGNICFSHVYFHYKPDKPVLRDVSLSAAPGQKIALVGSTGAGKTSITNLINRFFDLADGTITYDGIDINQIGKADLRSTLSMVLQDTHLFTGTVLENIRYGRLDATDEEVLEAARKAQCMDFLEKLPQGIHSMAGDAGKMLSGGQRQRISLARAILKDAPIVVLDEATAYADPENEEKMEAAIAELVKDKTLVVIAHKLPAIMNADQICVIDQGKLVAAGKHQDLIQSCPEYQKLWKAAQDSAEWKVHTAKEGN